MQVPQAAVALAAMLYDERADHRCNALWVADQLQLAALAPRVAEIARKDPDVRIARIAQHVSRRLARVSQRTSQASHDQASRDAVGRPAAQARHAGPAAAPVPHASSGGRS